MNLTVASRHKFPQAIAIWAYPEQPGKFPQVVVGGCYDDHCHHKVRLSFAKRSENAPPYHNLPAAKGRPWQPSRSCRYELQLIHSWPLLGG